MAGKTTPFPDIVRGVYVSGDYAYVADGSRLRVVDISTPSSPSEVGHYNSSWDVRDVMIAPAGGYAYVAGHDEVDWRGGLLVMDVSSPSAPTRVGSYDTLEEAHSVSVAPAGDYA